MENTQQNTNLNKSLYKNISLSYIIKGLSLLVSFLLTPIYIRFLGDQIILGVWFTVLSVMNWIIFFDFGLGNGLRNNLTKSIHEQDVIHTRKLITSTYAVMGIITIIFSIVGLVFISFYDLNKFFNVSADILKPEILYKSTALLFLGATLSFFLGIIVSILNSLQKSGITGLFGLSTNIAIFIFIKTVNGGNPEKNLLLLSLVFALSSVIPLIVATITVFTKSIIRFRPSKKYYDKDVAKNMLSVGGRFFWIQLSLMFINSTDQIMISRLFGNDKVVLFQLYHKLFYVVVTLFTIITNPIWSSISKAYVEEDYKWIKKIKNKLYLFGTLFVIGIIFLIIILQFVFNIWLRENSIAVNYKYAIIFGLYSISMIYLLSITAVANGMSKLKPQLIGFTLGMIIKIPLILGIKIFLNYWIIVVIADIVILAANAFLNIYVIEKYFKSEL